MWKVNYTHLRNYPVSRTYDTVEGAWEFINANALVCELPNWKLTGEVNGYVINYSRRSRCYIIMKDGVTVGVTEDANLIEQYVRTN